MATKHYALSATKRERAGKGVARALRREKQTPAVIYGDNQEPLSIALSERDINLEYNRGHIFTSLCDLEIDGKKHLVLARDVQLHPVTDNVIHCDFLRVTDKTTITVAVPVHFMNQEQCKGIKAKGSLNIIRHEVDLICQAQNIPDEIEVDMTNFEIGDVIKISHANLPEGTKPAIQNRDFTLASLAAPRVLIEDAPAEGAEEPKAEDAKA